MLRFVKQLFRHRKEQKSAVPLDGCPPERYGPAHFENR